ncbi:hypothetical protein M427DRAFT_374735 [Gonapodya prolifera JEL478]|uniref:Uncharacterized protein n=1 Tax=Gonapodya prolifera (strain JEL478) TaxID=1344416 RepID=A0A139AUI1_GONPJ|nr:hypothetical protein M427DRAFT_374735 [Gonapodya prolifera JEL478]|eukprot:KXS20400.1 hypothetical protein M427DRAFT_374735 [Gonapodya prolifera JEL478]
MCSHRPIPIPKATSRVQIKMKTVQVQELKNFLVGDPESNDAAPPPGGPTSPVISSAAASGTSIPPVLEVIPACRWGIGVAFWLSWRQGDDERKTPPVRQNSRFRLCHGHAVCEERSH